MAITPKEFLIPGDYVALTRDLTPANGVGEALAAGTAGVVTMPMCGGFVQVEFAEYEAPKTVRVADLELLIEAAAVELSDGIVDIVIKQQDEIARLESALLASQEAYRALQRDYDELVHNAHHLAPSRLERKNGHRHS
jgi:hypothetical protein